MSKKIICIITILCTLLVLGGCSNKEEKDVKTTKVTLNTIDDDEKNQDEEIKEVPNINKTIVIDPGHSSVGDFEKEPISPGSDKLKYKDVLGAKGAYTNIYENETTVSIGKLLRDILAEKGYNVIMTKEDVEDSISNVERAKVGNDNNADLVIRIHADSAESSSAKGASVLVPAKNQHTEDIYETSAVYGEKLINNYIKELNIHNRGVIERDDMTGFNWSDVPVVLIEMGFLSNKEDDNFISDVSNHEKIANAIANGIDNCFRE